LFKESFRKILSLEWNTSRKPWLRIQFFKTQSKKHSTSKTIGCFAETIGCLYQLTNIKTEFKELGIERMHTDVYTGSLQTQSYIQSSQKPLRNFTKLSHLDHLHHNQESDLDLLKTHTSLGQHTNTKIVDLDPLKNTQQISANTQTKLVQQSTRITLVTKENLNKSVYYWCTILNKSVQLFILSN